MFGKIRLVLFIVLIVILTQISLAQPPTPILFTTDTPWVDAQSVAIPFGFALQIIDAGSDHLIQPPVWDGDNRGQTSGDDFIVLTDTMGSGQPPIPVFEGTFAIGANVYHTVDSVHIALGDVVYARIYGAVTPQTAEWYSTSNSYTTVGGGETDTVVQTSVGVKESRQLSNFTFELTPSYPNPTNATVTIRYSLSQNGNIDLSIYNMLGQKVATLVHGSQKANRYQLHRNLDQLASGAYFVRLSSPVLGMKVQQFNLVK